METLKFNRNRILMFYPYGATKHFGDSIIKELARRGAIVYGYDERPSQNPIMKIIIRLFKKKIPQIFNRYIKSIIKLHKDKDFDYILICRGEAFTPSTIKILRMAYPKAQIVLYLWDILKCADVREVIPYCDKAFSFDPHDAQENEGLIYRPLFYSNDYVNNRINSETMYDLMFIGTLHSNRHQLIKKISSFCKENGLKLYLYLYVPSILVYIKDFIFKFPYINISLVNFKPISLKNSINILMRSKVVLDINYTDQKSLSSRACEAMAAGRKYITTNPEVVNYDFFNPNNIAIIDINNPIIPDGFIKTPFVSLPKSVMHKYSVEGLVNDLFSNI